jgi:hypothetical protein
MKYVREHINEKFTEDTDPIKDLRIGGVDIYDLEKEYKNVFDFRKFIQKYLYRKTISGKMTKWFDSRTHKITFLSGEGEDIIYRIKVKQVRCFEPKEHVLLFTDYENNVYLFKIQKGNRIIIYD